MNGHNFNPQKLVYWDDYTCFNDRYRIGKGSKIFLSTTTGAVIEIGNATDMTLTTHDKVLNLSIDRSVVPLANSSGIQVDRARFIDIDGVTVYNSGDGIAVGPAGITGIPTQFVNIRNSRFMANRGLVMTGESNGISLVQLSVINGGLFNYGVISDGTGFARYIENGIFENASQQQVFIGGTSKRVTVTDSWIGAGDMVGTTRAGIQIEPGTQMITIANNRIGDQRRQGLISKGDSVIINGNTFEGNVNMGSAACACDSLQVEGGKHITITGNHILNGGERYRVGLYDSGSYTLDSYIYTSNDTSGTANGYHNAATGATKVIANNLN